MGQSCHKQKVFSLCTQDYFGSVQLFVTLQTVACQASLSGTGGCCQNPCDPSSCTTFTLSPHWARAATGEKETTRVYVCRAALVVSNPVAL